ncbi:hypothetical protein BH11CYA1_BH11CYA1_33660 [soil metagenome]
MFEYTISILVCLMSYPLAVFSANTTAKSAALWFPKQYVAIAMTTLFGNIATTIFLHLSYFELGYPLWLVPIAAVALPPVAVLMVVAFIAVTKAALTLAGKSSELIVTGMETLKNKANQDLTEAPTGRKLNEAPVYVSFMPDEDESNTNTTPAPPPVLKNDKEKNYVYR